MAENNLLRSEAAERARLLGDLHYDVTLDLTGAGGSGVSPGGRETFRSETRLRCRSSEPGAETFLDVTAVRVVSATVNGAPVPADAFDGVAGRLGGRLQRRGHRPSGRRRGGAVAVRHH